MKTGDMTKALCKKQGSFASSKQWTSKYWRSLDADNLHCFCEPKVKPEVFHCAGEGETCHCPNGAAFFGRKYVDGSTTQIANFEQMRYDYKYTAEFVEESI